MASHSQVVQGYKYRLKKSQRYFDGLRALPQWGGAYFEPYFRRTFEAYTTLWRYQQTHRAELEQSDGYNMPRSEIGDVASKIGQLFYFYYLRTSDLTSLVESFTFYEAIRSRKYFPTPDPSLAYAIMHKKLRYYARYIAVALLRNFRLLAWTLLKELRQTAEEVRIRDVLSDSNDWAAILDELTIFLKAERLAWLDEPFPFEDGLPNALPSAAIRSVTGCSYRLQAAYTLGEKFWKLWQLKHLLGRDTPDPVRVVEAVLVSHKTVQVKFSELSLDMLRVAQSLEWEPAFRSLPSRPPVPVPASKRSGDMLFEMADSEDEQPSKNEAAPPAISQSAPTSSMAALKLGPSPPRPTGDVFNPNPRKALLYRPTYPQLSYVLSSATMEIEARAGESSAGKGVRNALLLYLSGDAADRVAVPHSRVPSQMSASDSPPTASYPQPFPLHALPSPGPSPEGAGPTPLEPSASIPLFPTSLRSSSALGSCGSASGSHSTAQEGEKDRHSLYLEDLLPFTRNPCFLILDTEHASTFMPQRNLFGQPLVCLMAPEVTAPEFADAAHQGSLFTLFLTHPVLAFWSLHRKSRLSQEIMQQAMTRLHACFSDDLLPLLTQIPLDPSYEAFLTNDFTRLYILRFIFCKAALQAHGGFTDPQMLPHCYPALPRDLFTAPAVSNSIHALGALAAAAD